MATRTRNGKTTFASKSDHVRALLDEGKTIAEITRIVPGMGYAFAYGIAKRAGKAETAAHRRATKSVNTVGDLVEVQIVDAEGVFKGTVTVNRLTGAVRTRKAK